MQALRTEFNDRFELEAYLIETFEAFRSPGETLSPVEGAARVPDCLIDAVRPGLYAATRNHLEGAVTRLSPYLRHGVVSLGEIRDLALRRDRARAQKLVSELGWRDFFCRVLERRGARIWEDVEPGKTGLAAEDYGDALPLDLLEGRTGLACMDAFSDQLRATGYLHNHARMWLAAYIVHWLRVRWQAGARWFLVHLLDGDLASNNLSFQWVAGTFSAKPYIFNRANLERWTDGRFCRRCASCDTCPFDASYEELEARLFPARAPAESGS